MIGVIVFYKDYELPKKVGAVHSKPEPSVFSKNRHGLKNKFHKNHRSAKESLVSPKIKNEIPYGGPLISPRLIGDAKGNSRLILDVHPDDKLEDPGGECFEYMASGKCACGKQSVMPSPPVETYSPVYSGLNKELKLKSVCCEKYKKGKRCKRCPCFDLQ